MIVSELRLPHMDIADILFKEGSKELNWWKSMRKPVVVDDVKESLHKWPSLHERRFRSAHLRWPPLYTNMYTEEELLALETLPKRCREIVAFHDARGRLNPYEPEQIMDIGQSIDRCKPSGGVCPCILPRSMLWCRRAFRLLEGPEKLRLQALPWLSVDQVGPHFTTLELSDLAGNAFCGANVMSALLAMLSTYPFPLDVPDDCGWDRAVEVARACVSISAQVSELLSTRDRPGSMDFGA